VKIYANAPFLLCLATLGWAGNCIVGRLASGEISPMVVVFLRWSIVVPILLVLQRNKLVLALPLIKSNIKWVLCMGAFGLTSFNALFYVAANYTVAVNLGIMQGTMPAFILILASVFLKTKVTKVEILGLIVALTGVIIVISKGNLSSLLNLESSIGDLFVLLAVFLYAGYTVGLKQSPNLDSMTLFTFLAIAAWISSVPLLFLEVISGYSIWPNSSEWLLILYVALIPSFMSQIFFMRGIELIGPGKSGLYTNLVPVYAAIMGVIILGEPLMYYHLSSLFVVFLGIFIFMVVGKKFT